MEKLQAWCYFTLCRDPFCPLWDYPLERIIYSVDWLKDPRCKVVLSLKKNSLSRTFQLSHLKHCFDCSCIVAAIDDGSIRFLSLLTTSNDIPVTGIPFAGAAVRGYHSYTCSSFPIWSIQASRLPGYFQNKRAFW